MKKFLLFLLLIFVFNFISAEENNKQNEEIKERVKENSLDNLKCSDYRDRILSDEEYNKILEICDKEIEEEKKKLKEISKESRGIKGEIDRLDRENRISQAYINRKTARANRLKRNINETLADIGRLKEDLDNVKKALKRLIFQRNQIEGNTIIEALMSNKTLSEFFADVDMGAFLEKRIAEKVEKIKREKEDLEELIEELEEKESVERRLAYEKSLELQKIKRNKAYKATLLKAVKKKEGGIKKIIDAKEKAKLAILRKKFTLASGEKVTFGEAYNIINPYKEQLGLDPAFVLAVLFQESGWGGKIGGNIGQCFYNQKNPCGKNKVMSSSQVPSFLTIMKGLGKNPATQKVSCPICRDGSYGGAMGPAQFMPKTWMSVRNEAAKIIGKKPEQMSPFVNHDAFIASGVYLKKYYYSKACSNYANKYKHISSPKILRERCAAASYYAGPKNWFKYRMTYGESVVKRANKFRIDIATLND